jgi:hypothetical protein
LFQHFLPLRPCFGIEPAANVAKVAAEKVYRAGSISSASGWRMNNRRGQQADLIIGNNVLAQVRTSTTSLPAWRACSPEGVIRSSRNLERLIAENQFDTI